MERILRRGLRLSLVVSVACMHAPTAPTQPTPTGVAYDRDLWGGWIDANHDCQDTRTEVLIDESLVPPTLSADGCRVIAGQWLSYYDGELITAPRVLDIDHLVPLAEAHRSGGSAWSRDRKLAYANDLDDAEHLVAVTARSNRQKSDQDPSTWRPRREAWCRYARAWRGVKVRWTLMIDAAEEAALREMESSC